ncbi:MULTISPECIES: hypothetical protein [unclassified Variovorax]|uniref:hypothetical protein n=1 Tax=unclassified Variovorax TaxID=663243 RepID=UPI001BD45AF9|nr:MULTISPECIES: hypothetical protein [unclassified Variovorax]
MTVMFTRIGTPHAGHQQDAMVYAKKRCEAVNQVYALHAQVYARFGGPAGQVVMLETFENMAALEKLKMATMDPANNAKIPVAPEGVFQSVEEHIWIKL